jgi:hypothetical protein
MLPMGEGRVGRSIQELSAASLSLLAVLLGGCGGGDGGGVPVGPGGELSCTSSEANPTDGGLPIQVCEEASGLNAQQAQMFQQQCSTTPPGTVTPSTANVQLAPAPCSRDHALGGCRITAGGLTEAIWYYDDGSGLQAPSDIQTLCGTIGATFIPANG